MLKCIECNEPAEYIYKGNSVCREHLDYATENGKISEVQYLTLLKDYKGKVAVLDYFWNKCNRKHPNLSFNSKIKWLKSINKVVEDFKIKPSILDTGINIVINKNKFNIGFLIQVLKTNQVAIDKKKSVNNLNQDVYAQIANNT